MPENQEELKIGPGEGEVPLMRTMESDLKSLQESGGQSVRPYIPQEKKESISSETQVKPEETFQPPQPEVSSPTPPPSTSETTQPKPSFKFPKKIFFLGALVLIVLLGGGALGYFFVYPALFGEKTALETEAPVTQPQPSPETPLPPPSEEPALPQETQEQPTSSETTSVSEEPAITFNLPSISEHLSFFKTKPETVEIKLTEPNLNALKSAIAFSPSETPSLKELLIKTPDDKYLAFSGLMPLIVPQFFNQETLNYFEEDYTAFVYTNSQGTWLGFIAKLKENVNISAIQDRMSALQKDQDNKNFFLVDVGEAKPWTDGFVKGKPSSLGPFSKEGATLSYTWFERYLLISTHLEGAERAATLLGF